MDEEEELKVVKVVLIGESGVGKTAITNYFLHETFESDIPVTTSAAYASKTIKYNEAKDIIKFDVWDTAGQENYRSLARIFYKDAGVAILVYDMTNLKSFEQIQNYWCSQIKEHAPKANKFTFYNISFLIYNYSISF